MEILLNRPRRWELVSITKFFRAIEVVPIVETDKVDEEFRYKRKFANINRFPKENPRYKTHAYSFKKQRSEPYFKAPALPKLSNIDTNDRSDITDLFYIDLFIRFGCSVESLSNKMINDLSWFERYEKMREEYSNIRPETGM
jgi:hypothetical protein